MDAPQNQDLATKIADLKKLCPDLPIKQCKELKDDLVPLLLENKIEGATIDTSLGFLRVWFPKDHAVNGLSIVYLLNYGFFGSFYEIGLMDYDWNLYNDEECGYDSFCRFATCEEVVDEVKRVASFKKLSPISTKLEKESEKESKENNTTTTTTKATKATTNKATSFSL
jgi:hypothetical protein